MLCSTVLLGWSVAACGSAQHSAAPQTVPGALSVTTFEGVDGRTVTSRRDRPALISFLALGPGADGRSRNQLTVLKSMAQQYGAQGLVVAVGDTSGLTTDELVNLTYDWNLQGTSIVVLTPAATKKLAATYNPVVPDTTLAMPHGAVLGRWQDSVATAQELALPIQDQTPPT